VPNEGLGVYCVTKYGVVALAECHFRDLRPHGIGVSVLCPMRVETNIGDAARNRPNALGGPATTPVRSEEEEASLTGRVIAAEEVAERVMNAVRRGQLYIHTHAEARPFVRRRFERIDCAFDE
jgi:NAD(P)-dependent dehydrogenase (short-subunit alcohol dehydrogenase family)